MSDPTLESLKLLDDPARFRVVRNVPIFKPHVRKDAAGKKLYEITDKDIPEITRRTKALEEQHGVIGRITSGHVKPGQAQKEQPPLLGYFRNAHEGTFGPTNEPATLADYFIRAEDWEEFKNHPYRSAEFYPGRQTITGVACLKTDPELDLGVLVFEQGEECYHYGIQEPPTLLEREGEMESFARCLKKMFPHLERIHNEHAERYAATGPGTPCSTNASPPKMSTDKDKDKPVTLESLQEQLVTYERENAATKKQVADLIALNGSQAQQIQLLERRNVVTNYERDLEQLHYQFAFDLDEEKLLVANYSPEQFEAHKKIMSRYQRRPHTVPTVGPNGMVRSVKAKRAPTPEECGEAISFATTEMHAGRQISYERAEAAVMLSHDKGVTLLAALDEVKNTVA